MWYSLFITMVAENPDQKRYDAIKMNVALFNMETVIAMSKYPMCFSTGVECYHVTLAHLKYHAVLL